MWNQFIIGGETPIPKIISTPGFTEASVRAAIEVAERKVMALQRFMKRIVEHEIFASIVKQAGYDPGKGGSAPKLGHTRKARNKYSGRIEGRRAQLNQPRRFPEHREEDRVGTSRTRARKNLTEILR